MSICIFLNQTFLELKDVCFGLSKDNSEKRMPKSIIYQNVSLRTVRLSMEKTSMTNPLIMILNNIKK